MKRLVVLVGDSLFRNYMAEETQSAYNRANVYYPFIKGPLYDLERADIRIASGKASPYVWEEIADLEEDIQSVLERHFARKFGASPEIAAELSSLEKIITQEPQTKFAIHLLATETSASMLAAKLLKYWAALHRPEWEVHFEWPKMLPLADVKDSIFVVKGLRVKSAPDYAGGLASLTSLLERLAIDGGIDGLNITTAPKSIIPALTHFAAKLDIPLYFLQEGYELGEEGYGLKTSYLIKM